VRVFKFDMPKFGIPKFGVPKFGVPKFGVPKSDILARSRMVATLGIVFGGLGLAGAAGCVSTDADVKPQNARVTITGASELPLQLVTSTNFFEQIVGDDPTVQAVLVAADTTAVTLPFEQTIALDELGSVLVRLIQPDSMPSTVSMQVMLDGVVEYDQAATLSQGGSIEYRFVFTSRF
jgi:hypothetical protein